MKKFTGQILFVVFITLLLLGSQQLLAQQSVLYNSQTLAESADNPWVSIFDKKCQQFGFNFFFPSIFSFSSLRGDGVNPLLGWGLRNQPAASLSGDTQGLNHFATNNRVDWISLKINRPNALFKNTEWYFGYTSRVIAWGSFKNLLLDVAGGQLHKGSPYALSLDDGPFNGKATGYAFNETSAGWRADLDDDLFAGVKIAYLSGVFYTGYHIKESAFTVTDAAHQSGLITANGSFRRAIHADSLDKGLAFSHFLPNFNNPGLSVSGGIEKWVSDRFKYTLAVKDLGFIYWQQHGPEWVNDARVSIAVRDFEMLAGSPHNTHLKSRFKQVRDSLVAEGTAKRASFTTILPARAEVGASALLFPNYTANFLLIQTFIENRTEAMIIHDLHKQPYHIRINTGYDSQEGVKLGLTFLLRSAKMDVFAGTENLIATTRNAGYLARRNEPIDYRSPASLGFVLGFSMRIGKCNAYSQHKASTNRNIIRLPSDDCCQF